MKQEIEVFDYAKEILGEISRGVLLTTRLGDRVNSMTIGWGMLGVEWGKPIFTAFVREGRFTRTQLDGSGDFSVNIPFGACDRKILAFCGSHSGRDTDKIAALGLTAEEPLEIRAPGIRELPLTLECRVLYRQLQDRNAIPAEIRRRMYPEDVDGTNPMANRDCHIAYYGEIVKAYLIQK